jgi:two-component system response regulator HydG
VLVVDDEVNMRASLTGMLQDAGYDVSAVESAESALRLLARDQFLMVITDARLGGMSGYELLAEIKKRWPQMPVLMITAYATPRLAVEAIKAGAEDYVSKPFAPEELLHAVQRCLERRQLIQENAALRVRGGEAARLENIIGESPGTVELRRLIQTVAPTNATVLILGESGTGKELIAGALHTLSQRREHPYVRINCAAIPETLLESELFGHERGAFTGAIKQRPGRVEEAHRGTLFLDEIGDMSRSLQAKLLRFLEDGSFTRVGGNEELRVNVRVIAATNRDIVQAIRDHQFREDLFHRLNVVQICPAPLRQRGEDILVLAEYFLHQFAAAMNKQIKGLSRGARELLLSHSWPGNVRELRNAVERAVILETTHELRAESLPDFHVEARLARATEPAAPSFAPAPGMGLDEALAEFERAHIQRTLERNRFSLTRTAEQLKISRHALRYRMQRLNINLDEDPDTVPPADTLPTGRHP